MAVNVLFIFAISQLPFVGMPMSILLTSFLISFHSFGYSWSNKGWNLAQEIEYMESHWIYFSGFGLILTCVTWSFPILIRLGLISYIFPFYIIMSSRAIPRPSRSDASALFRLPIFYIPEVITAALVRILKQNRA
jgi:hypothetical protein